MVPLRLLEWSYHECVGLWIDNGRLLLHGKLVVSSSKKKRNCASVNNNDSSPQLGSESVKHPGIRALLFSHFAGSFSPGLSPVRCGVVGNHPEPELIREDL